MILSLHDYKGLKNPVVKTLKKDLHFKTRNVFAIFIDEILFYLFSLWQQQKLIY